METSGKGVRTEDRDLNGAAKSANRPISEPYPSIDGVVPQRLTVGERRLRSILGVALLSIVAGGTADLVMDQPQSWLTFHVVFETAMVAGALVLAISLWTGWWRAEHDAAELRITLLRRSAERDRWRAAASHALEGLGRAIDAQFEEWRLTAAEREVALLLLKGLGHKQIAAMTGRSERTARQHAGAVYEKAGLGGRADLSAFFLQDLMLPRSEPQP
jgi:DNA-binding CsgD family transcriptional regulator